MQRFTRPEIGEKAMVTIFIALVLANFRRHKAFRRVWLETLYIDVPAVSILSNKPWNQTAHR